ncbi:uncharacterized protein LOC135129741 [Zophobas morio]|uniref:uncharacterized protein LOC135129741 n=1 Tax=Zophobas morio TaxID=2755281 RepID=UPI003082D517
MAHQIAQNQRLLTQGITLFGLHHRCEPSEAPPPTPVQCTHCFKHGHTPNGCPNQPICPTCPNTHPPNKCPQTDPKSPFCVWKSPRLVTEVPQISRNHGIRRTPTMSTLIIDPLEDFAHPIDVTDDQPPSIDPSSLHPKQLAVTNQSSHGPLSVPKEPGPSCHRAGLPPHFPANHPVQSFVVVGSTSHSMTRPPNYTFIPALAVPPSASAPRPGAEPRANSNHANKPKPAN